MAANTYYQDELRYLREVGPEFAKRNPAIAHSLGDPGSDPDVERILEGAAFLCGRVRQKLDDELPELTATLMGLLWPHYLRSIPSMSILEFTPSLEGMQAPLTVKSDSEFCSKPIEGTKCRYRSCWPTTLRPWRLESLRLDTATSRPVQLTLLLQSYSKAPLADLQLDSVRFHLAGEPRAAFLLYLLLTAHLDHVTVSDGSDRHDRPEATLSADHVQAAGLKRSEGVLPYPPLSFPGYRLLQEYLAFKERFLFVDFLGLGRAVRELGLKHTMELHLTFNRRFEAYPLIGRENMRLHCVPIINLFPHPADPIVVSGEQTEYLVQPSRTGAADRRHLEIYSIDEVHGLVNRQRDIEQRKYQPFFSFRHRFAEGTSDAAYYQAHLRPSALGEDTSNAMDTYLSLVRGGRLEDYPDRETISVELTCTNRHLPGKLRAGDITEPTDSSPLGTSFRNLLAPTIGVCPPLGRQLHWRLISHMALNYVSLANTQHFKELLKVYGFQAEADTQRTLVYQRMLDGIVSIKPRFMERMIQGSPIRGSRVDLELNEDHFAGEGDAYLFSVVLDQFMRLYATMNSCSQVVAHFTKSGSNYAFPVRWGCQATPAERGEDDQ